MIKWICKVQNSCIVWWSTEIWIGNIERIEKEREVKRMEEIFKYSKHLPFRVTPNPPAPETIDSAKKSLILSLSSLFFFFFRSASHSFFYQDLMKVRSKSLVEKNKRCMLSTVDATRRWQPVSTSQSGIIVWWTKRWRTFVKNSSMVQTKLQQALLSLFQRSIS